MQTRTIASTHVITYQYDAANRLTNAGGVTYTWGNNGNLLNDGSANYLYDHADRLISITLGGTTSLFSYNGDGARLKQIVGSEVTTYTQDLAAPLPVVLRSKTGVTTTKYLYSEGTRPMAQNATAWEYLLPDGLGSVRQIANTNGYVNLTTDYEPYGSVLNSSGNGQSAYGFAGEERDTYIKLVFLRARYYSPEIARFLSKDVWQGDYTRPQSLNTWAYAEGNPILFRDPSGRIRICNVLTAMAAQSQLQRILAVSPNAGEKLFRLFEDDFAENLAFLCAGINASDRLEFVLDATAGLETDTSSLGFPAQFYIDFGGDCGLAEEFRDSKYYDMYPDTWGLRGPTNQPGHFLTAVAMAYRGVGLAEVLFWPRPEPGRQVSIDERIALGLIVGHEKVSDASSNPYYTAQLQYWSADESDVSLFLSAIGADERGDKTTRDDYLRSILNMAPGEQRNRVGNSLEDLRLSLKGWRFGKWVLDNRDTSHLTEAQWLRDNIGITF